MKFGLDQHIIDKISAVFEEHTKVDKAFVFGSRAKGNYRSDSDIDIVLKGQNIDTDDIIAMSVAIEAKGITQKFDLIDYYSIKEPALKEHVDRVGIKFYSRWREYKISDIISLEYGKSLLNYRNGNGKYDVFGTNGKIGTSDEYIYDKPAVIIGRKGAYRETHLAKKPFFVIDTAFYTKNKLIDLDILFLYYWFKNININEMDSGSAIPSTSRDEVYDIDIQLPPFGEQAAIASILSSFDDKISLLHHQNITLEQLAETLFRHWFIVDVQVEFISLKTIVDVIDNRGKTPPLSDIKTDFPIVEVKSLSNNNRFVNYDACEKFVSEETYTNWFRKGHPILNDILISTVGSIGEMAFVIENKGGIAQNVVGLRAKNISPFYLYQFLSLPKTRKEIKDLDIGAVQPSIKVPHLLDLEIPIPKNKKLIKEFDVQLIPMFEKMKVNHFQIKTITQNRNTLLPKLMSGEVRVNL